MLFALLGRRRHCRRARKARNESRPTRGDHAAYFFMPVGCNRSVEYELGCGDAGFGRQALDRECSSYVGVEGSRNMVALAQQTLAGTMGRVIHADLETWPFPKNAFDLVVSRLVLQYLSALEPIHGGIFDALDSGGGFIFSVEHLVITSCDRAWQGQGPRQDWIVDNYFDTGARDPH